MSKTKSNQSGDLSHNRPLTDSDEAVERENQKDHSENNESGSSKEEADFDTPNDDPA